MKNGHTLQLTKKIGVKLMGTKDKAPNEVQRRALLLPTKCIFHLASSVLNFNFSFINSVAHVGQMRFQNQPNEIYTNVDGL